MLHMRTPIPCAANALTPLSLQSSSLRHAVNPSRSGHARWVTALLCALAFTGFAEPAGVDLRPLQSKLETDLINATTPALKQYVTELQALEKKAAAARDYDTAIAVRSESQKIEAQIASQEKLSLLLEARQQPAVDDAQEHIVLKPADAKLERVRYDPKASVLTDWSGAGSSATWQLPSLPAGGYDVVLHYASGPLEGGSVLVQEMFYTLSAELGTTLKGFEEQNLGTLRVRDGTGIFKISAKTVLKSNLMQLQSVELVPTNH